jgi:pilus assembly protein CpaF
MSLLAPGEAPDLGSPATTTSAPSPGSSGTSATARGGSWQLILPFLRPIQGILFDDAVSEIMVNGDGGVFVERSGEIARLPARITQTNLLMAAKALARHLGDDVSETQPILDARLDDGSRVAAVLEPVSLGGITLTIRKFSARHFNLDDLLQRDSITPESASILIRAVRERRNLLIAGGTGTGKTTILNILSMAIPDEDRVLLIEDTAEISIEKPNLVRFEAKRARRDSRGSVTYEGTSIRQLLKAALRHRPDRIIVGEIRDGAAYDLLQALNTGHGGSMSTVHADSAQAALQRFAALVLESGVQMPFPAIKANIAAALHYLVYIERRQARRYVAEVLRLDGYDPDTDRYQTEQVYVREGRQP